MTDTVSYCLFHRVRLPDRYPVQPRPEMAAIEPVVVAARGDERLLCNGHHDGPHLWPDGDEVYAEGTSSSGLLPLDAGELVTEMVNPPEDQDGDC